MGDYMCLGCGQEFSADPGKTWYEQDGDTITVGYTVECPHCGRKHSCREFFRWDGITDIQ